MRRRTDQSRLADEELVQLACAGDAHAFETVYDRHGGAAFSLAYRILGNRQLAEDATQEAFLATWRGRARYSPERGSVRAWLLTIVHSRAIDVLRHHGVHERRRATLDGVEEIKSAPEQTEVEVLRRDQARTVRGALAALPGGQFEVIELAYFGGFSAGEIASMLEVPLGTVKGRMRLGLQKLRQSVTSETLGGTGLAG